VVTQRNIISGLTTRIIRSALQWSGFASYASDPTENLLRLTPFQAPPLPNIPIPEQRHFLVPDLLSNTFSGRDDVLACIHRSLRGRPTRTISRVAIWGIPGIGKTQIALRFANRYSSEYQNVFYVNASSSATILFDYRSIIRTLLPKNQPPEEFDEREIQDLFAEWLVKNQNWLLIYDNAIRPASVRGYTPVRGSGHIIFTTRNVVAAEQLAERKDAYEVLALPMTQAVSLILHLQNIVPPVPQAEQAAARLAQAVQGLPIAIEQAVLLARLRGISLAQIIPDFEKRRDKRRELLQQSHPASMHEDECSVGALVTMTLETLSAGSPQAHSLFKLLVYFDPSSIPISFLTNSATELQHHFARQETYDRGLIRTPKETKEAKFRALEHVAFHDFSPLEKDFWFSRGPFRSKTPVTALPKIESEADKAVERFYKGNRLLQDVLEKDNRIENALLDLQEAGLIRRLNDKTVWIHDLFAQLTIAILEEESLAVSQIIAHLVLLITYLSFPIPDRGRSKDRWRSCLPHATCILTYCAPFYKHLTMGPELAHLTASALYLICSSNDSPESRAKVVQHYKLAHAGYHYAWGRLKGLPWITEGEILLDARAEYNWENAKGLRNICRVHRHGRQRFGSSPAARTLQTLTNLAEIYNWWEQYPEAVNWATLALKGFRAMYGEIHDETFVAQQNLLKLYKAMPDYGKGYAVGKLMARNHMKKWGAGLVSLEGAGIALDIGDCAMGLANFHEAGEWYQITLRGLASFWGDDDRTQLEILQRLVRAEQCQHNHTLSLQYALRAERIYHQNNRQEESQLRLEVLTPIQLAVALQHFERGNSEAAREWVEMVFVGPEWKPLGKEMKFRSYRSIEDMRLRAIWLWGCMEYGDANVQDWEIAAFNIGKDFTHEACSRFGPLRNPCCAGVDRGTNGYRRLTKAEEIQILVDEADEMVRSWDRECEMRSLARQLTSSVSATDQG
jgi:tetratricopeptide (TPR) repeat protein